MKSIFRTLFFLIFLVTGSFLGKIYSQEVVIAPEILAIEMVVGDSLESSFNITNNGSSNLQVHFSLTQLKVDEISKEELIKSEERLFAIARFFDREITTWIYEFSLESGELLDSIAVSNLLGNDLGLAYDKDVLFYEGGAQFNNIISKYDLIRRELISNIIVPKISIQGLGVDKDYLYGLEDGHSFNQLFKIDRESEEITQVVPLEGYETIIAGGLTNGGSRGTLYVVKDNQLIEVDKNNGKIVKLLKRTYYHPITGVGYSESKGSIYIATLNDDFKNVIVEIDPDTDTKINEFLLPQGGYGYSLASDENGLASFLNIKSNQQSIISPGNTAQIDFSIETDRLISGSYLAIIQVLSSDTLVFEIPIELEVKGKPELAVNKDSLDFGELFVGGESKVQVELRNTGTEELVINDIEFQSPAFFIEDSSISFPLTIEINAVESFQINFSPDSIGETIGTAIIKSNFEDSTSYLITLTGVGIAPPVIEVDLLAKDFTMEVGQADSGSFLISNIGEHPLSYEIQSIPRRINGEYLSSRLFMLLFDGDGKQELTEISSVDGSIKYKYRGFEKYINGLNGLAFDGGKIYTTTVIQNDQGDYELFLLVYDTDKELVSDSIKLMSGESELYFSGLLYNNNNLFGYSANDKFLIKIDRKTGVFNDTLSFGKFFENNSNYYLEGHDFTSRGSRESIFFSYVDSWDDNKHYIGELDIKKDSVINTFESPLSGSVFSLGYSESEDILWVQTYTQLDGAIILGINPSNGEPITKFSSKTMENTFMASDEYSRGNFVELTSALPDSVLPGQQMAINYKIETGSQFGGSYQTDIVIKSNDPKKSKTDVSFTLQLSGIPEALIERENEDFGEVFIGGDVTKKIKIFNPGTENLIINSIEFTGNGFGLSGEVELIVSPDDFQFIPISFTPTAEGEIKSELRVFSNAFDNDSLVIYLVGIGAIGPTLKMDSTLYVFNLIEGSTETKKLKIINDGGSTLEYLIYPIQQDSTFINIANYNALVVLDSGNGGFAEGLNIKHYLQSEFTDINFSFVEPEDFKNTEIDNYHIIITVSDQQPPYEANIIQAREKLESFLKVGGDAFFSSASKGAGIILPGGLDDDPIIGEWRWDGANKIVDHSHPISEGVDTLFFGGSRIHFTEIPNRVDTIAITPVSFHPTLIEYSYGFGNVLASGVALEESEKNGWSDMYENALNYMFKGSKGSRWIYVEKEKGEIINDAFEELTVNLSAKRLPLGSYEAQIYAETNEVGKGTVPIATIQMNIVLPTTTEELLTDIPTELELSQNYPNPFNPSTNIAYGLPGAGNIQIKIYNVLGQEVMTLVDDLKQAGRYTAVFDARNLASGMYFYRMVVNGRELEIKKMLLLK